MALTICYEDAALVVCLKPAGVVSEAGTGKGMPELLVQHYREQNKPDFIAGVHRLDKGVGGVMVFSRRKDVTGKLTALVAQHKVEKEYVAILRGTPAEPEAVLEDLLFHDARTNKTFVVQRQRKGVRPASLSYRTLARCERAEGGLTLVQVRLHTGRTHQIRAQFSARGLPLLGDIRYGSRDDRCGISLWSCHLSFVHPRTGKRITVTRRPPQEYPWDLFPADAYPQEAD